MNRPLAVSLVLVLLLGATGLVAYQRLRAVRARATAPFACLATATEGWLTASAGQHSYHAEFGPGRGLETWSEGPLTQGRALDESDARRSAVDVTAPFGAPPGPLSGASATVFAMCDGHTEYWRPALSTGLTPELRTCLAAWRAGAVDCLKAWWRRDSDVDERIAAEVARRMGEAGARITGGPPPPGLMPHLTAPLLPPGEIID